MNIKIFVFVVLSLFSFNIAKLGCSENTLKEIGVNDILEDGHTQITKILIDLLNVFGTDKTRDKDIEENKIPELIKKGADINKASCTKYTEWTPLRYLVEYARYEGHRHGKKILKLTSQLLQFEANPLLEISEYHVTYENIIVLINHLIKIDKESLEARKIDLLSNRHKYSSKQAEGTYLNNQQKIFNF